MLKQLIKTILYCIFITINLIQCSSERSTALLFLYSKDKKNVVTVITDLSKHERIIANGKHFQAPPTDFYKLDISNISELGDEIGVCWKEKGWEIVNNKAKITEIKIDTTNFIFRNKWFTDDDGISNAKYYRKSNCFTVGFSIYSKMYPPENGFIERK